LTVLERRLGDLISYQNGGKGSMANACNAGEREWVFHYMDKYAPRQRPHFGISALR